MPSCKECQQEISEKINSLYEGYCPKCAERILKERMKPEKVSFREDFLRMGCIKEIIPFLILISGFIIGLILIFYYFWIGLFVLIGAFLFLYLNDRLSFNLPKKYSPEPIKNNEDLLEKKEN